MSLDSKPTAIISFQQAMSDGESPKVTVWEHVSHLVGSPLNTFTSCKSSVL